MKFIIRNNVNILSSLSLNKFGYTGSGRYKLLTGALPRDSSSWCMDPHSINWKLHYSVSIPFGWL